jgi:hypothetical protein
MGQVGTADTAKAFFGIRRAAASSALSLPAWGLWARLNQYLPAPWLEGFHQPGYTRGLSRNLGRERYFRFAAEAAASFHERLGTFS